MKKDFQNHTIIAVDCDDVISNTITYFLEFYDLRNLNGNKIRFEDIKNYNFSQNPGFGKNSDEFVAMFVSLFENDMGKNLIPPMYEAKVILKKWKQDGKKLHLVTARQSFLEEYTRNWIEKYFPNIFEAIHFCNHEGGGEYKRKSDICKEIGATLLIDDSLSNILACGEACIDTILFNKPWNSDKILEYNNSCRVDGWKDLV